MEEDRELPDEELDARTVVTLMVVAESVANGKAVSPCGQWKPNITPAARDRA